MNVFKKRLLLTAFFLVLSLFISTSISYAGPNEDLLDAAKKGDINKIKTALDKGADVNAKDQYGVTALILALNLALNDDSNAIEIAKLLIDKGADVNAKTNNDYTALISAIDKNQTEIVKLLLDKGADVDTKKNYLVKQL